MDNGKPTATETGKGKLFGFRHITWGVLELLKWGLPPVWQINLVNLAFVYGQAKVFCEERRKKLTSQLFENQSFKEIFGAFLFSSFVSINPITLFEFNKPISKKEPPILKDFEEFASFFKGFRMDFEINKPNSQIQS